MHPIKTGYEYACLRSVSTSGTVSTALAGLMLADRLSGAQFLDLIDSLLIRQLTAELAVLGADRFDIFGYEREFLGH